MKIKVTLLDGTEFDTDIATYNAQQIAEEVNMPEKFMVAIGDLVVNSRNIKTILKVDTQEPIV